MVTLELGQYFYYIYRLSESNVSSL